MRTENNCRAAYLHAGSRLTLAILYTFPALGALGQMLNGSLPLDFADSPSALLTSMQRAFDPLAQTMLQEGRWRPNSLRTFRANFTALATHLAQRSVSLRTMRASDFEIFAASRNLSVSTARRYLLLVRDVDSHHAQNHSGTPNVTIQHLLDSQQYRYAHSDDDLPPVILGPGDQQALIRYLADRSDTRWTVARDKALVAVAFCCGPKPAELLAIRIEHVMLEGPGARHRAGRPTGLRVAAGALTQARVLALDALAQDVVGHWLELRQGTQLLSPWLFPSGRSHLVHAPMDTKSAYTAQLAVRQAAGVRELRGGLHVLRHTYGVRSMQEHGEAAPVAESLGIVTTDRHSIAAYQQMAVVTRPYRTRV